MGTCALRSNWKISGLRLAWHSRTDHDRLAESPGRDDIFGHGGCGPDCQVGDGNEQDVSLRAACEEVDKLAKQVRVVQDVACGLDWVSYRCKRRQDATECIVGRTAPNSKGQAPQLAPVCQHAARAA